MCRFIQILPFSLLALCLAQDSGLYVNRIKIQTYHNDLGNEKAFTYYVADSFTQPQVDQYKTDAGSIGNIFEDDYAADTVSCTVTECQKLRRIYSFLNTTGTKTTTQLFDSAMIVKSGITTAKPIGFVAPYPGYCSSDDKLPIIEMYSDLLGQYAYWSPAQQNQLVNLESTTIDKSRFNPIRLVGYALSAQPERLVLENAAPDYVKPIGKANYTHSFFPTWQLVQFSNNDNMINIVNPTQVDMFPSAGYTIKNTGIFLLQRMPNGQNSRLEAVCGERVLIYAAYDSQSKFMVLYPKTVPSPFKPIGINGYTFKFNKPACGGIKGLAKLYELKHPTKAGYNTYENDEAKIKTLEAQGWAKTTKELGFAPLDKIGFILVNAVA